MAMLGPMGQLLCVQPSLQTKLCFCIGPMILKLANSFSEPITPVDHHHWFTKGLIDPNRLLLIATAVDGCPIGQIRFDRLPVSEDAVVAA